MTAQSGSAFSAQRLLLATGGALAIGAGAILLWPHDDTPARVVKPATRSAPLDPPPTATQAHDATPNETQVSPPPPAAGFDLVRVDAQGRAVIAGHAAPDSRLELTLDGATLEQVDVNSDGTFVALLDLPVDAPAALGLAPLNRTGAPITTDHNPQTVLIAPTPQAPETLSAPPKTPQLSPAADAPPPADPSTVATPNPDPAPAAAPQLLLADDQGITVLQDAQPNPATPPRVAQVIIDAITYDTKGELALSGRGQQGAALRVYLDNRPVQSGAIAPSGQWHLSLPNIDSGIYTLRVDELAADGTVASRMETPFKREDPTQFINRPQPKPAARIAAITVQPGSTLWAIARDHLGKGPLYVRVFAANRDKIRDPDLIYPGQVFAIPDAQ